MKKWQTKVMLVSTALVLVATGTVALANDSTSTGLEITGTPVTLQAAAGAASIAQKKMDFNQYTWESDPITVTLTVPPTVSIGTYNATIHYELQNGVVSK